MASRFKPFYLIKIHKYVIFIIHIKKNVIVVSSLQIYKL